jgi:diphthine-ammonia ligase
VKVFSSWSGGKDCALATYRAMALGHEISCLLNFVSEDGERSRSHGILADVMALQAEAMGIPLVRVKTSWEDYEKSFKNVVAELKGDGITGGVFGDMELAEHREWIERVCGEVGVEALLPLWGVESRELLHEFLGAGFKAMIVATRLEKGLLGKVLDEVLVEKIVGLGSHPCGEGGEYHTFVVAGPFFKRRLVVIPGSKESRDGVWFLDIAAELQ